MCSNKCLTKGTKFIKNNRKSSTSSVTFQITIKTLVMHSLRIAHLLLQVSEKELEEFPEPPVDHTDQDKPDNSNTGGTHSSNISPQLQTQTQTSTASEASKVPTASPHSSQNVGIGDWQCDQLPCTHSHIGKGNMTSRVSTFLHC